MRKKYLLLLLSLVLSAQAFLQVPKELILNTTGYGFDRNAPHANAQWDYIQKFMNLTHNSQDASVTAVRFYINWEHYEPTLGDYQRAKLVEAIQDLVNLKGGTLKVALHFPYSRPGFWNDSYFPDSTIARIYDGTMVGDNVAITNPSIYSEWARQRFYAFVDDALAQLGSFYNKILYVQVGNTSAEEFSIPWLNVGGYIYPGMHDQGAVNMWRNVYLPCRYPGQSTVTWDGNTHTISNAPLAAQGQWPSWSTDHGREFHRFASWGLMRFYQGFRDIVKNRSNNLKVLFYVSDFGSQQGNAHHLHNASLPMALDEFDGIYTTEADLDNIQEKIAALDVLKGTRPNKIAAIEFDPTDLGQLYAGPEHILPGVAEEWIPRGYKHGADYIHLAMHYHDPAIATVAPALAMIRANYVNGSYQSPSRQSATTVNIQPTVFQGAHLFLPTWNNLNGNNWSATDNSPVSINMIDDGYWENVWSCSGSPDPCAFTIDASGPTGNVVESTSVTLNVSCSGSQCTGVSYSWSGNGISGNGNSVTFNAPATPGSYTYTVTASKSGCSDKTDTVNITVVEDGGGGPCDFTEKGVVGTWNGLEVQTRQFTINGQTKWAVVVQETTPNVDRHFVRGDNFVERGDVSWTNGPVQKACLGAGETGWGGLGFPSGVTIPAGYIQDTMPDGAIYFELASSPSCDFDVSPSASDPTPTGGSSITLSANCSGGDCGGVSYSWSGNGISGSNSTVSFNAPTNAGSYTYTVTASKSGCSNKADTVNITVESGAFCPSIEGDLGTHCYFISGWVYDPNRPNEVLYVDIYDGTTLIAGNVAAGDFRQDLLDAGKGNGYHGFLFSTEGTVFRDGNSHNVVVKLAGCNDMIPNSPKTLNCSGMLSVLADEPSVDGAPAQKLGIYPNPGNGMFQTTFFLERGRKATLSVVDLQGRIIHQQQVTGQGMHREKINLFNKASGTLILRLVTDKHIEVKRFTITR